MNKYPLIGISICAVILLVLASLTNVIGYQTVQSSNQTVIDNEVNQKELLFQTIVDIANNKEIQQVILKSQGFFNPDSRFSIFASHFLTKMELNTAYHVGLMLSKNFDVSRIRSMFERYRGSNQALQKEITAAIEKDATLNRELTQLSNSKCNCEDSLGVTVWQFPVICRILGGIGVFSLFLILTIGIGYILYGTVNFLGQILNCPWTP